MSKILKICALIFIFGHNIFSQTEKELPIMVLHRTLYEEIQCEYTTNVEITYHYKVQILAVTEKPLYLPKIGDFNTYYVKFDMDEKCLYKIYIDMEFSDRASAQIFLDNLIANKYICDGFVAEFGSTKKIEEYGK